MGPRHIQTLLSDVLASSESCILLDQRVAAQGDTAWTEEINKASQQAGFTAHQMDAHGLNEKVLLRRIGVRSELLQDHSESAYRQIIHQIDGRRRQLIVVEGAENLVAGGLHLVARLARYIRDHRCAWKILLIGDRKIFDDVGFFQLPIDCILVFDQDLPTARRVKGRAKSSKVLAGLMALALVGTAWAIFVSPSTDLNTARDQSTSAAESARTENSTERGQTAGSTPGLDDDTFGLDDSQWLSDEEFTAILASLRPQESEPATLTDTGQATAPIMPSELREAIRQQDKERILQLLDGGIPDGARNELGQTMLIVGSILGDMEFVERALGESPDVDAHDQHGRTALYYAAVGGHAEIMDTLIKRGADVDKTTHLGKTPLMAAVHNDHHAMARVLLQHEADLSYRDHSGWSALFYAVWGNNAELVSLLVRNGANLAQLDNDGNSVVALARARRNPDVMKILAAN